MKYCRAYLEAMKEQIEAQGVILDLDKNSIRAAKQAYMHYLRNGGDPAMITPEAFVFRESGITDQSVFVEKLPGLMTVAELDKQNDCIEKVLARA